MAPRFELFLKHRVVFTPACPPLQDASTRSCGTALQLSGLIYKGAGDCWSVHRELEAWRTADTLLSEQMR